jgi:hypothetical protein
MSIRESEAWSRLVEDYRNSQAEDWRQTLLADLDSHDVEELVTACLDGSPGEQMAAVVLLMRLSERQNLRLDDPLRSKWTDWLRDTVRRDYPCTLVSLPSFQAWREQDKAAAEAFLVKELPPDRARDEMGAKFVVAQLSSFAAFGSESALERLERLEDLPDDAAKARRHALTELRPLTSEEVETLSESWRRSRSAEDLFRIYDRYIVRMTAGKVTIDELVGLLGTPTKRQGNDVWYQPASGTQLLLEGDAEGRLRGCRWI